MAKHNPTDPRAAEFARCEFLRLYDDLEAKTRCKTQDLPGIAASLRQLLLDNHPVAVRAASTYQRRLAFHPSRRADSSALKMCDARPAPANIDHFVSSPMLEIDGTSVSTGDVVRYFAHVKGGVHAGKPRKPGESALQRFDESSVESDHRIPADALRTVAETVLESLAPLRRLILRVSDFDSPSGLTFFLKLKLFPLGGDRDNVIVDFGVQRHQNRITIFIDQEDRICARYYIDDPSKPPPIVLRSPPEGVSFNYGKPLVLAIRIGVKDGRVLAAIDLPRWSGITVQPTSSKRCRDDLFWMVLGSDLDGRAACRFDFYEQIVTNFHDEGSLDDMFKRFTDSGLPRVANRFETPAFLRSTGHPSFAPGEPGNNRDLSQPNLHLCPKRVENSEEEKIQERLHQR